MAETAKRYTGYLVAYNVLLALGWSVVLWQTIISAVRGRSTQALWHVVEIPLKLAQTAAVLEVAHSITGVVRSPFFTTLMQVFSRIWLLWGIVNLQPQPTTSGNVPVPLFTAIAGDSVPGLSLYSLLYAWSITEVIRYLFYALKELDSVPYTLTWLRYTTFYVLYPLGVASEMAMVYLALPSIKNDRPWSVDLPNSLNFAFDYYWACLLIVVAYLPGFPQLYLYMIKQRKKVLAPPRPAQKVKAT